MDPENEGLSPAADRQEDLLEAVNQGVEAAGEDPDKERREQAERDAVAARWKMYETARKHDERARAQYAVDRRYAAGTAIQNWPVSTNLIGAFIDILVAFLYARNPDVSIKKSPRVDNTNTQSEDDFARTAELVVSALWRAPTTDLKARVRQLVRSVLTVGVGWLKVIMVTKGTDIPQMRTQLNDIRDNIKRYEQLRLEVTTDENGNQVYLDTAGNDMCTLSEAELNAKVAEFHALEESIQNRIEVAERKALAVDFVSAEDMQVSLDVPSIFDYKNAGWMANRIYREVSELKAMFPDLTEKDLAEITHYHQRRVFEAADFSDAVKLTGLADQSVKPELADSYVAAGQPGGDQSDDVPFACVVEMWSRKDNHVYTMIDGLKKWARQPYQPQPTSTRIYPYFGIGFYPTDGARHPQSLSWRLRQLQDEYCSIRSSRRLTRSRAIPGIVFNRSLISPDDAAKLERSVHQEMVGLDLPAEANIRNAFAEKPISVGDMRLYDASDVLSDMEKIAGVQEAMQASVTTEKTATEAEIQQTGFAARTGSDRDVLEGMMSDLAHYTLEIALGSVDPKDAQRLAGKTAMWPYGMAIDDLLTMVEVSIEAGTTGKPKSAGDKAAWGTIMPILTSSVKEIQMAQMTGNIPLADALSEIVKETMRRMGDETDVSRFLPKMPQTAPGVPGGPAAPGMMPPPGGPPGALPPAPGDMPPADDGSLGSLIAPEMPPIADPAPPAAM